jgi:hypothetical protein
LLKKVANTVAAGVGKTILAYVVCHNRVNLCCRSIAINYLEGRAAYDEDIAIACVYFDHKQDFEPVTILRSILKSVVQCRAGDLSDEVRSLYEKHVKRDTHPTLKEISKTLQLEMSHFSKVFIVFDALDECATDQNIRSKVLDELKTLQPKLRLMVTGRPFAATYMSRFDGYKTLEIRARDSDIKKFVEGQIDTDESVRKYTSESDGDELRKQIVDTVVIKAKGMYGAAIQSFTNVVKVSHCSTSHEASVGTREAKKNARSVG